MWIFWLFCRHLRRMTRPAPHSIVIVCFCFMLFCVILICPRCRPKASTSSNSDCLVSSSFVLYVGQSAGASLTNSDSLVSSLFVIPVSQSAGAHLLLATVWRHLYLSSLSAKNQAHHLLIATVWCYLYFSFLAHHLLIATLWCHLYLSFLSAKTVSAWNIDQRFKVWTDRQQGVKQKRGIPELSVITVTMGDRKHVTFIFYCF